MGGGRIKFLPALCPSVHVLVERRKILKLALLEVSKIKVLSLLEPLWAPFCLLDVCLKSRMLEQIICNTEVTIF